MSILSASRAAAAARAFICLAAVGLTFPNASATLIGDTVSITLDSPNGTLNEGPDPISFLSDVVVGAGKEVESGNGSDVGNFMLPGEWIDIGASSINLRVAAGYELSPTTFLTGLATGGRYIFSSLNDDAGTITGLTFSVGAGQITNLASLGSSWVRLSNPNTVIVELDKMTFATEYLGSNGYADITINLQVTAVPEPGTAGMMLLGLGLLGLGLRKRQS